MIEPIRFGYNEETGVDNKFQHKADSGAALIAKNARSEMLELRSQFIRAGVYVVSYVGRKDCPDDVFPNNWVSTSQEKGMFLYPMATPSRRRERREDIINLLKDKYDYVFDLTKAEQKGKYLEGTGVFVLDHICQKAFIARSKRTDDDLIKLWGNIADYEPVVFNTHDGKNNAPVYHTNVICHIGTGYAALCPEMIAPADRRRVVDELEAHHDVITLTADQVLNFSGNALEVVGREGARYLALSDRAYGALNAEQIGQYKEHVSGFIQAPIPTIENYGGGSVRCMVCELY